MKITGKLANVQYDFEGHQQIVLTLDTKLQEGLDSIAEKPLDIELKEHKKKRSLNANAYLWALCTEISEITALRLTKEQIYRRAIKESGLAKDFHNLTESEAKTLKAAWERLGVGWFTEKVDYEPDGEHIVLRCYYGSSSYDTKQMSRVIERLVQDARACGIQTMTQRERTLLYEEWSKAKEG